MAVWRTRIVSWLAGCLLVGLVPLAGAGERLLLAAPGSLRQVDEEPPALAGPARRWRRVELLASIEPGAVWAENDRLRLNLFADVEYVAVVDRVAVDVQGVVSIRARLPEFPLAYLLASSDGKRRLVTVDIPELERFFSVLDDPAGGGHLLVEQEYAQLDVLEGAPAMVRQPELEATAQVDAATSAPLATRGPDDPTVVDMMIVYTAAARQWANSYGGGIAQVIAQTIQRSQLVFDNSNTLITLRLAHAAEVAYTESGSASTDLQRLSTANDGHLDEIHAWRNQYGADLVAMLVGNLNSGGIAWQLNSPTGYDGSAFSVTRIQQAVTSYTFVHEIGHNLGAHHRRDQSVQPGPGLFPYSAAWRWIGNNGRGYCSVMSYEDGGFARVPVFSNPNVLFEGVPSGRSSDDNARTLREVRQVVAGYRTAAVAIPANDNFAAATSLAGQKLQVAASNRGASREAGEPFHANQPGGASIWWRWTATAGGQVTVDTFGSTFDTLLAVYTGTSVANLAPVAANDDDGGGRQSRLTFPATAGQIYHLAVDGHSGATGNVVLNLDASAALPANDAFAAATAISGSNLQRLGSNVGATRETGEPNHAGEVGGSSVWWAWTAPAAGAVLIDTFGSTFDTLLAIYTGTSVGNLTLVGANDDANGGMQSQVVFNAVAGVAYRIAVDGRGGGSGNIVLNLALVGGAPANDAFANAASIAGTNNQAAGLSHGAGKEPGEPNHAGRPGGASVWWRWTAPAGGATAIDTFGSNFDTLLAVYTGTSVGTLTVVAANDDSGDGVQSRVSFVAAAGVTYHIAVDGVGGATGGIALSLVLAGGAPANDALANAIALAGSAILASGSNDGATREVGEPSHAGNPGGASVWWRWTAPASGSVTVDTTGSSFDTLLAVYTGASMGALALVAANDDAVGFQSLVTFVATAGVAYRIAVDGYNGATGNIALNLEMGGTGPVNDLFANATPIVGSSAQLLGRNVGAGREAGEPPHFFFDDGASVWWRWTAPASGSVTIDTFGSSFDTILVVYVGNTLGTLAIVAANDDANGQVQSRATFEAIAGTAYQIVVDGYDGDTGNIVLNLSQASTATGTLSLLANPPQGGSVAGGGQFAVGSTRELSAQANDGWLFAGWSDGQQANPRAVVVAAGQTVYTANFILRSHTVSFDLGTLGLAVGGGPLVQVVLHGGTPLEPLVQAVAGWVFAGWTPAVPTAVVAPATLVATYADVEPPTLAVSPAVVVLTVGAPVDSLLAGVAAADNADGDLSGQVQVVGAPNPNLPGDYLVRYNVLDAAGNAARERTRTYVVEVDPTTPWSLPLLVAGATPPTLTLGMAAGATDGFDPTLDAAAPPVAAGTAWLADPSLDLRYAVDRRAFASQADFLLVVQAGATAVVVGWNLDGVPTGKQLSLWQVAPPSGPASGEPPPVGGTAIDLVRVASLSVPAGQLRAYRLRYANDLTIDWRLAAGWNAVSLPVRPPTPTREAIFATPHADLLAGKIWQWTASGFVTCNEFPPLVGHWLQAKSPAVVMLRGFPVWPAPTELQPGWNVVAVDRPQPLPAHPAIDAVAWQFDAGFEQYAPTTWLLPGRSYWLHARQAATLFGR